MPQELHVFTILLLSSLPWQSQAQLQITPKHFEENYNDVDLSAFFYIDLSSQITNLTADSIALGWRREVSSTTPSTWAFSVADVNISYPPSVNVSPQPNYLGPGETVPYFSLGAFVQDPPGCADVSVIIYDYFDPAIVLDTITYAIHVNSPDCAASGIGDVSLVPVITLSPNPVHDLLCIQEGLDFDQVEVFNVLGSRVYHFNGDEQVLNVSGWEEGMYVLRFLEGGRVVGVGRVVKG